MSCPTLYKMQGHCDHCDGHMVPMCGMLDISFRIRSKKGKYIVTFGLTIHIYDFVRINTYSDYDGI